MPALDDTGVRKVLVDFAAAYTAKDTEAVLGMFSDDPDGVLVGTGADEIRVGPQQFREQITRDLQQVDRVELELGEVTVSGRGDVAWTFSEAVVTATSGGERLRMPVRMTLVLVQGSDGWRIHSGHLSVAAAEQREGESFAAL